MAEKPMVTDPGLSKFASVKATGQSVEDRRGARRFPYAHVQQIGFFVGNRMPAQDTFRPVRCHEISQDGLSFFYPTLPDEEQLVIALGSQGLETLVLAKVLYHVPAQAVALFDPANAVDEKFLIECAFVRRVGA